MARGNRCGRRFRRDGSVRGIRAGAAALALALFQYVDFRFPRVNRFAAHPFGRNDAVLNNLKLSPETRHIPVQIITMEEERQHGLSHGAFS